jgi:hypothetical protein
MDADHSEQQRHGRELNTCCAGHSDDLAGPGYQPELPRGGHGSVRPASASAVRAVAGPLWFELMRWPFRIMWCFVNPSNASDRGC